MGLSRTPYYCTTGAFNDLDIFREKLSPLPYHGGLLEFETRHFKLVDNQEIGRPAFPTATVPAPARGLARCDGVATTKRWMDTDGWMW